MNLARKRLQFGDVDGLAFAAAGGKLHDAKLPMIFVPQRLGPLLELLHLSHCGLMPRPDNWVSMNEVASLVAALDQARESWVSPASKHAGFIRAVRRGRDGDSKLTGFLMHAKRAGRQITGLSAMVAGQLVAAMEELENNIHEHAEAADTGLLAYRAEPDAFEFVAADRGVGILHSLRHCAAYATLTDDGKALETALTDGVSRHGPESNRGHGFRPLFRGLMNLNGELRFRSGDHAITMDGTSPTLATSRISQKARIDGFFASVRCHVFRPTLRPETMTS